MTKIKQLGPGLLLCLALAVPCWLLGKAFPIVGGPVFAILSGMVVGMFLLKLLLQVVSGYETILSYAVIPVTMVWNFLFADRIMAWCRRKGGTCYE